MTLRWMEFWKEEFEINFDFLGGNVLDYHKTHGLSFSCSLLLVISLFVIQELERKGEKLKFLPTNEAGLVAG